MIDSRAVPYYDVLTGAVPHYIAVITAMVIHDTTILVTCAAPAVDLILP